MHEHYSSRRQIVAALAAIVVLLLVLAVGTLCAMRGDASPAPIAASTVPNGPMTKVAHWIEPSRDVWLFGWGDYVEGPWHDTDTHFGLMPGRVNLN